ncbi:hypothetical protein ACOMHN_034113 [Nucella lapillus]
MKKWVRNGELMILKLTLVEWRRRRRNGCLFFLSHCLQLKKYCTQKQKKQFLDLEAQPGKGVKVREEDRAEEKDEVTDDEGTATVDAKQDEAKETEILVFPALCRLLAED